MTKEKNSKCSNATEDWNDTNGNYYFVTIRKLSSTETLLNFNRSVELKSQSFNLCTLNNGRISFLKHCDKQRPLSNYLDKNEMNLVSFSILCVKFCGVPCSRSRLPWKSKKNYVAEPLMYTQTESTLFL